MHLTCLKLAWSNNESILIDLSLFTFCVSLAREKNTSRITLVFQLSFEVNRLNLAPVDFGGPLCGLSYVFPRFH